MISGPYSKLIKTRMRYIIYTLIILTTFSCQNYKLHGEKFRINKKLRLHEGPYHTVFKNRVFTNCIRKIHQDNTSPLLDSIIYGSLETEYGWGLHMNPSDYKSLEFTIDSIAISFSKRPEARRENEYGPETLRACLAFRNSKELDYMAVSIIKKYNFKRIIKNSDDY